MIEAVGILVPARNEEQRITRCLDAIVDAVLRVDALAVDCRVVVALDSCTDATGDRAARALAPLSDRAVLVPVSARSAGTTRRAAADVALDSLAGRGVTLDKVWLATTDADSVVPRDWLTGQLRLAQRGWALIAGTVSVGELDPPPTHVRAAYRALLASRAVGRARHTHVYGANLGVRADVYVDAGGFPPVALSEEWLLLDAVAKLGHSVLHTRDVCVATSGRRRGRASGGLADLLHRLDVSAEPDAAIGTTPA